MELGSYRIIELWNYWILKWWNVECHFAARGWGLGETRADQFCFARLSTRFSDRCPHSPIWGSFIESEVPHLRIFLILSMNTFVFGGKIQFFCVCKYCGSFGIYSCFWGLSVVFGSYFGQIQWYLSKLNGFWTQFSGILSFKKEEEEKMILDNYSGIWGRFSCIWGKFNCIWVKYIGISWKCSGILGGNKVVFRENAVIYLTNTVVFWENTVLSVAKNGI